MSISSSQVTAASSQLGEDYKSEDDAANPCLNSTTRSNDKASNQDDKGKGKRPISSPPLATQPASKKAFLAPVQNRFTSRDLPRDWPAHTSPSSVATKVVLAVHKGDLFNAPSNALLIHACNTQGSWGAGIAKAFRTNYPKAYAVYRTFCLKTHDPVANPVPTGTALLIAPVDDGAKHWIGCLFTSAKYGKAKARPEVILRDTKPAMEQLLELVRVAEERRKETGEKEWEGIREVRMCKINSGLFAVPWERTAGILGRLVVRVGWKRKVDVWEPCE